MAAYLTAGQIIEMDGTQYELDRQIGSEWQISNRATKRAIQIQLNKLLEKYACGDVNFVLPNHVVIPESIQSQDGSRVAAHLDLYPENVVEQMKRSRLLLECHLKECGDKRSQNWLAASIQKYWEKSWGNPPSTSTLARLLKRYMESGKNILSLAPRNFKKGNSKPRYPNEVIEICLQEIKNIYLKPERGSLKLTIAKAQSRIKGMNLLKPKGHELKLPTNSLVRSLIQRIPEYDKYAARHGRTAADNRLRNAVGSVVCDRPLQRVEVDHTQMDIMVVDSASGMVIGRPYLTVVIDVYTRTILGFHLSFDPPSHMVVAKALKMALLPKNNLLKKWGRIKGQWPMYGCMQTLVVDNGLEFHGKSLEAACLQLGIQIAYCPRKQGRKKPHVERVIGTLNRQVTDGMPGRTFSNTDEKGDYDSVKQAAIPLDRLEEMIAYWIVDIYHEEIHSALGVSPRMEWLESISEEDIPLVPNTSDLDAIMGVIANRSISHNGIVINNLRYNCEELGNLRMRYQLSKVCFKWNPEDLSYIHVLPPDGSILRVPVVKSQQEYATGLSLYLHNQCQQYANNHLGDGRNHDQLMEARNELYELGMEAMRETKKKTRAKAHRLVKPVPKATEVKSNSPQALSAERTPSVVLELPSQIPATSVPRRKLDTQIRKFK